MRLSARIKCFKYLVYAYVILISVSDSVLYCDGVCVCVGKAQTVCALAILAIMQKKKKKVKYANHMCCSFEI